MDIATRLYTILHTNRKLLAVGVPILILIFLATIPIYGSLTNVRLMTYILMFVVMAVSWAMFSGATGYMSLAPAAFYGVGAYTMGMFGRDWSPPAAFALGISLSFLLALLVGMVTLRLKGMYFAIFTFGLVILLRELYAYLESAIAGVPGRHVVRVDSTTTFYAMLAVMVVTLLVTYFIRRSRWGLALQGIGGNEEAALHMGVNTTRVKIIMFAISALFMGAAGAIGVLRTAYLAPSSAFNPMYSFMPILMCIFGGVGTFYGPIIGAAAFAYAYRMLSLEFGRHFMLVFGIILIVFILFLPGGLASLIERGRHRLAGLIPKLRKGEASE